LEVVRWGNHEGLGKNFTANYIGTHYEEQATEEKEINYY
jgi:hypothetical protein